MIDVNPMLAQVGSEKDLDNPRFAAELKADGTRCWLIKEKGGISIFGRPRDGGTISDYTKSLPELVESSKLVRGSEFVIDAEAVVWKNGRTWFEGSQHRCSVQDPEKIRAYQKDYPIVALAFDLLKLDGRNLTILGYEERKRILKEALQDSSPTLQYLPHTLEGKREFFNKVTALGEEGAMLKMLGSQYETGRRSSCWLKVKRWHEERVRVVGYTPGEGKRDDVFGSLVLAKVEPGGDLRYVGKVGTGFSNAELRKIYEMLRKAPHMDPPVDARDSNGIPFYYTDVKIGIDVVVRFGEVSKNGVYRFPTLVKDGRGQNQIFYGGELAQPKPRTLLDMLQDIYRK